MKDKYNLSEVTPNHQIPEELKSYITNKQIIPWALYDKYHNLKFNARVQYKCKLCGREGNLKWLAFDLRQSHRYENICGYCYNKLNPNKIKEFNKLYPNYGTKEKPIPFNLYLEWKDTVNTKKFVHIHCKSCGQDSIASWDKLKTRIYDADQEICSNCINKHTTNNPEWQKKNSVAQKIAQNRPEVIEKQRIAQAKAMERDPTLSRKKMSQNNRLRGIFNNIPFYSSYELSYLLYNSKAQECQLQIPYQFNKKQHIYFPDFIYLKPNGKYTIVEVKGAVLEPQKVAAKIIGVQQFIKDNNEYDDYEFIDYKQFKESNKIPLYYTLQHIIALKKYYHKQLYITSIPNTFITTKYAINNGYSTKQELIDYINSL